MRAARSVRTGVAVVTLVGFAPDASLRKFGTDPDGAKLFLANPDHCRSVSREGLVFSLQTLEVKVVEEYFFE